MVVLAADNAQRGGAGLWWQDAAAAQHTGQDAAAARWASYD